jgi:hypothetical protein
VRYTLKWRPREQRSPNALGIKLARVGITAECTPVGTQTFIATHSKEGTPHACGLMNALDGLPPSFQRAAVARLAAAAGGTAPTHPGVGGCGPGRSGSGERAFCSLCTLMQRPCPERGTLVHLQMSLRLGGFGLRHTTELDGNAVLLSAAAMAHRAMETRPAPFQPLQGRGAKLTRRWEEIFDAADGL